MKSFILICLILVCLSIYLFVQAPPPLNGVATDEKKNIPAADMFIVVNQINTEARKLYTGKIVGGGKRAGLEFGENWVKDGVEKGPLPALFLREVASELEKMPPQLGLFLGSNASINPSNNFTGDSMAYFEDLLISGMPIYQRLEGYGSIAMFPDLASVKPCVTCHNEHQDSPKNDWKVGDIMGATTWTWPSEMLSETEFSQVIIATYNAVWHSYNNYLQKVATFSNPPIVGDQWPDTGIYQLPGATVFLDAVMEASSAAVMAKLTAQNLTRGSS